MQLFTRTGTEYAQQPQLDGKGKPFFVQKRVCGRCGGAGGSDAWKFTGWTCYDCGGKGSCGTEVVKLYTREQLDKMNAAGIVRAAKKTAAATAAAAIEAAAAEARRAEFEAAHADLFAAAEPFLSRSEFVADVISKARTSCRISEAQADAVRNTIAKMIATDAAKAGSAHVGTVGARIATKVTVERVNSFDRPSFRGFGVDTVYIVSMRDEAGNTIVSKSASFAPVRGDQLSIKATIKEHSEYRGEAQTVVQRVAVC